MENKKDEIEITPEMIEAFEAAYADWRAENAHAFEDGGTGDVVSLWASLASARKKASKST